LEPWSFGAVHSIRTLDVEIEVDGAAGASGI